MQILFLITILLVLFFSIIYLKELGNRNKIGKLDLLIRLCTIVLICIVYFENLKQTEMLIVLKDFTDKNFQSVVNILQNDLVPLLKDGFKQMQDSMSIHLQTNLEQIITNLQNTYNIISRESSNQYSNILKGFIDIQSAIDNIKNIVESKIIY